MRKTVHLARFYRQNVAAKSIPLSPVYDHINFPFKNDEQLVIFMPMRRKHKFGQSGIPTSKRKREPEFFFFLPGYFFITF
jgi:hypothetical protein